MTVRQLKMNFVNLVLAVAIVVLVPMAIKQAGVVMDAVKVVRDGATPTGGFKSDI